MRNLERKKETGRVMGTMLMGVRKECISGRDRKETKDGKKD